MVRKNTRQRLLQAAGRVVIAHGVASLTLEAVASEAGVSKGGLLYHFASKDDLLAGMVDQLIELTEQRIDQSLASDHGPGSWTRGYLAACAVDPSGADPVDRLSTALLAAGAAAPHLLDRLRERQAQWRKRQREDGIDPLLATVVRLAADGLWMNDLFGIEAVAPEQREALLVRLKEMTHR